MIRSGRALEKTFKNCKDFLEGQRQLLVLIESPSRSNSVLLNEVDVSVFTFSDPIQILEATTKIPPSPSKEPMLSLESSDSQLQSDSDFLEPTQDPAPEDESCSGLTGIQVCAINLFSVHSNFASSSVPTDIRIFDYTDPNESLEDDLDPLVDNLDPSFDRDNPH